VEINKMKYRRIKWRGLELDGKSESELGQDGLW
jgi:hypothetical protein